MRKDIQIPEVKDVYVVAVKEWSDDFLSHDWYAYLLNNSPKILEMAIVVSQGHSRDQKTATLRHGLGNIPAQSTRKIELLTEEVLSFTNRFMLTFFKEGVLYEKTFTFAPYSISDSHLQAVPLLNTEAVSAK